MTPPSSNRTALEAAYRFHDPALAGHQRAEGVVVGPEGIVVLASANPKGETDHTWLLRLTDDGALAWEQHYDPDLGAGRAIDRLVGGGYAIAGDVQRGPTAYQGTMVRIDAAGSVLAASSLGPRAVTGFYTVHASPGGAIAAAGTAQWKGWLVSSAGAAPSREAAETAEAAGTVIGDVDEVRALAWLASGELATLSSVEKSTTGFGRAQISARGPAGDVRWRRLVPTIGRGDPVGLLAHDEGALAIGNGAARDRDPTRIWIAQLDAAGAVQWERAIERPADAQRARAVAGLPDGGFAIAGETASGSDRGPHVWRLARDGTPRWDRAYGGAAGEQVTSAAATADGGLVVAGSSSDGPGKTNVWVIRIAADGELRWRRVFGAAR